MGLFDQVLSAISNPNQQANPDQLGMIFNTVQQFSNQQGIDPTMSQAVLSLMGNHVRSALQQKQATAGQGQVEALVNQYHGTTFNPQAVQAIFSPNQQTQVIQDVSQRTGIPAQTIQAAMPLLIPLVLNFLQTGASNQGGSGGNPVLNQFLDSDRDGDVDVGDAIAMAGQFLNQRR